MVSIWILVGRTAGSSNDMIVNGSTRATAISNHPSLSLSLLGSLAPPSVRPSSRRAIIATGLPLPFLLHRHRREKGGVRGRRRWVSSNDASQPCSSSSLITLQLQSSSQVIKVTLLMT
jgi:hypothetical protein